MMADIAVVIALITFVTVLCIVGYITTKGLERSRVLHTREITRLSQDVTRLSQDVTRLARDVKRLEDALADGGHA